MIDEPRLENSVRRPCLSVAAAVAAILLLAGCGNGGTGGPEAAGDSTPTKATAPATWPLTGLDIPAGKSAGSPAYIVKIDNTSASRPQVGLGKADLVVQELVEGGMTRLAVFFHSQLPSKVGPVRSMRVTDIGIAKPLGAEIVTSGAAQYTLRELGEAGVDYADMSNPAVRRISDGTHDSLHSVMADLSALAKQSDAHSRPVDYLPWGAESKFPKGRSARAVDVRMSTSSLGRSAWAFRGGKYFLTEGNYMPKGDGFAADTVIVVRVRTSIAGYRDPAGNPVPISHFEGAGDAIVFHGGTAVRGTWKKAGVGSTVTFATKAGPLTVPAGRTWLHLVPVSGGGVSFR